MQDQEIGDGTTSVVIVAAELLKNANELVKYRIHPTSIISGYKLACKEAVKYIQDNLSIKVHGYTLVSLESFTCICIVSVERYFALCSN